MLAASQYVNTIMYSPPLVLLRVHGQIRVEERREMHEIIVDLTI